MTAEVNLHELINKPGYGKHIPTLTKAGKWDEWAGMPMKRYEVLVEYTGTDGYVVNARCEDEACEKAHKLAEAEYTEYKIMECEECN